MPCRVSPLVVLAFVAVGCGPSVGSGSGDGDGDGGSSSAGPGTDGNTLSSTTGPSTGPTPDSTAGPDSSDSESTPPPLDCEVAPLEIFDIEGLVGEPTVVQEVEVLQSGEVMVAGYFGLARGNATTGDFVLLDAPEVVTSSFVRLTRGSDRELWVSAFDQLAHSPDAGDTWQTWSLLSDALVYRLSVDGEERIYLGGDATLGAFANGQAAWTPIPALDGDSGNFSENNAIMGLVWSDARLLAVERFGRMAESDDGTAWVGLAPPLVLDPELVDLGELGLFLLSSTGDLFHSDDGITWAERGVADSWPGVASSATQLAHRPGDDVLFAAGDDGLQISCDLGVTWKTLPLGTRSDVIYDVSVGTDGSLWAAGFNEVFRVGP